MKFVSSDGYKLSDLQENIGTGFLVNTATRVGIILKSASVPAGTYEWKAKRIRQLRDTNEFAKYIGLLREYNPSTGKDQLLNCLALTGYSLISTLHSLHGYDDSDDSWSL